MHLAGTGLEYPKPGTERRADTARGASAWDPACSSPNERPPTPAHASGRRLDDRARTEEHAKQTSVVGTIQRAILLLESRVPS